MPDSLSKRLADTPDPVQHCAVQDCLILQYHRVALLSHDPLRLAVQPCNFERQMEYLASSFNVISLAELKQHLETAAPFRDGTVVVTFDGGYSDVLYTAKEVLEHFEIPATVFVPSVHLIERAPFWWDVLEDVLIAGDGHDRLAIELDGTLYHWPVAHPRDRFRAFDDLYAILSGKSPSEQRDLMDEIARHLGGPGAELDNHATLGMEDLKTLEDGGLITIGGYPHHGTSLSLLPEWEQVTEIGRNKQVLEEVLGHRIEHFACPSGDDDGDGDTNSTTRILKGLGFTLSCRMPADTVRVTEATDPYGLPRVSIQDWNPFTFHRRLETLFG